MTKEQFDALDRWILAVTKEQFDALERWILAALARNSCGPDAGPGNYRKRREEPEQ